MLNAIKKSLKWFSIKKNASYDEDVQEIETSTINGKVDEFEELATKQCESIIENKKSLRKLGETLISKENVIPEATKALRQAMKTLWGKEDHSLKSSKNFGEGKHISVMGS